MTVLTAFLLLGICAIALFVLLSPFRRRAGATPAGSRVEATPTGSIPASTAVAPLEGETRAALLDEKDRLFATLADLRFDYEAGKLSREDFEEEDARLRERAAAVLRELNHDSS